MQTRGDISMKIQNIRYGGSTNSSSTHSIIFRGYVDGELDRVPFKSLSYDEDYGWEYFDLSDRISKISYAYLQVFQRIWGKAPNHDTYMALKAIFEKHIEFPEYLEWLEETEKNRGHIDHNSMNAIETNDYQSFSAFVDMVVDPRAVIKGGNDNDDRPVHEGEIFFDDISKIRKVGPNTYTIFDRWSGNKVRIGDDIQKGFFPELVDMKITDYCTKGCAFCYQNSTKKGIHAKHSNIMQYLDILQNIGTFEVVLGGGEPTSHPDFADILYGVVNRGMSVAFTTATDEWISDTKIMDAIRNMKNNIRFGVSVTSLDDIPMLENIFKTRIGERAVVHIVLGALPPADTLMLIDLVKNIFSFPILLLGWKDCGRGKPKASMEEYVPIFPILREYVNSYQIRHLSVDTSIVDTPVLKKALDNMGVKDIYYASPEGKFSMYIDAVEDMIGPSSYHPDKMKKFEVEKSYFYNNSQTSDFLYMWRDM